jgi:hypothetical protein
MSRESVDKKQFSKSIIEIPFKLIFQNATRKTLLIKINDFPVLPIPPFENYPGVLVSSVIAQIGVFNPGTQEQEFIGEFSYKNGEKEACHPWISEAPILDEDDGKEYYIFYYYLASIGTITEFTRIEKLLWDAVV